MSDTSLPGDLQSFVRRLILKRVAVCVLLCSLCGAVLALWGETIFRTERTGVRAVCYGIVLLIPFALSGVPLRLIDRTYRGRIEKIDVVTTVDNASSAKPTREGLYVKNTVYLSITEDHGRRLRKKAYEEKANLGGADRYKVGDTVFHLYGTKHIVVIPRAADSTVQCPVCGSRNEKSGEACRHCGHTLIKK